MLARSVDRCSLWDGIGVVLARSVDRCSLWDGIGVVLARSVDRCSLWGWHWCSAGQVSGQM